MKKFILSRWTLRVGASLSVVLLLFGIVAVFPFAYMFFKVAGDMSKISAMEKKMRDPKIYEPAAKTLALYCQSYQSLTHGDSDEALFPQELDQIGRGWIRIGDEVAYIEFGGGFYHFGYRLARDDELSTPETYVWQLSAQGEDKPDQHLCSVTLPSHAKLSPDEVYDRIVAAYDRQIGTKPSDLQAHQGKIQAALQFNHVPQARQACHDMLKAMPDEWWPVLINALLAAEEQSPEHGAELLNQWVQKDENFFRYLDLAYFYTLTSKPHESATAILEATRFDANTAWGEDGNSEFRGYTAAMCAYRTGEYEVSLKLCDHLLPVTINRDFAKPALRELHAASEKALKGNVESVSWDNRLLPFDPFKRVDIEKLLGRAVPRPTERQP